MTSRPTGALTLVPQPSTLPDRAALSHFTPWTVVLSAYLNAGVDSAHTRRAYARHLRLVFGPLEDEPLSRLSGAHLAELRAWAMQTPWAPASQAQCLAAVRSFLLWSGRMGAHQLPPDVIRAALRTPATTVQKPYQVLSEPEIRALLAGATTDRDRALLAVLLGGGLRVAEAVALDVADVREDGDGGTVLHVRQGKGRKDRMVPVQPDVARLVRAYLASSGRRLGGEGPLFRAHDRGAGRRDRQRLTDRAVDYLVARSALVAGITAKSISPHSLRHSYALRALRSGGNVVAVSKLLGHASVTTTQRYVDHLALSELRQAVPLLPLGAAGTA